MDSNYELKAGPNKFYIGENPDRPLAEIQFKPAGNNAFDVHHTYVAEELRGQGIGDVLLERMVELARQEGKKIIPTCPFVKKRLEENEIYKDLLAKPGA